MVVSTPDSITNSCVNCSVSPGSMRHARQIPASAGRPIISMEACTVFRADPHVCGAAGFVQLDNDTAHGRFPRLRGGPLAGNCYYCGICWRHLLHCPVDLVPEFPYGSAGSLGPVGTLSYPYYLHYLRGEACLWISLWSPQAGSSSGGGVVMPARGRQGDVSLRSSPIPPG